MKDELEMIWKKRYWTNFKVLSWHSTGEGEKNHQTSVRIAGLQAQI
jgi:hypothetical protein